MFRCLKLHKRSGLWVLYSEAVLVAVDSSAERLKCIFLQQSGYCTAHGRTILTKSGKDFVGKNIEYFKV